MGRNSGDNRSLARRGLRLRPFRAGEVSAPGPVDPVEQPGAAWI